MYAEKLKELGVTLPAAPGKGGLYAPTKTFGENKLMYVSGCGCNIPGEESFGKLGQEYTTEQGQKWARNAMMNVLAVLERDLGSLDRICSFDKAAELDGKSWPDGCIQLTATLQGLAFATHAQTATATTGGGKATLRAGFDTDIAIRAVAIPEGTESDLTELTAAIRGLARVYYVTPDGAQRYA